jgi:hypothetical protein
VIHSGCADAAAAYEQMRNHVLQGSPCGGQFGLILVMREGVAAWIDRCAPGFTPVAASANVDRVVALPDLSPQLHAGIVDVLVNIAMATRKEIPL